MKRFLRTVALLAFHALFVRPMLRLMGVRFRRRSLVPRGPCLVVANHNSHLDAPLLMSLFPLRRLPHVHPVAAADYFGKTALRRTMAMILMNGVPIERRPTAGVDPLNPIVEGIKDGESYIFFPEGSRGEAGVVAPFRPGVGRLVRTVPGLLVVPVFMAGPERSWPRGSALPQPLGLDVCVGKPRTYSRDRDAADIAVQVREDVLALAPPPPPVPGPRPAPPVRVAVCGIDTASRRALFASTAEKLGLLGPTVGLSHPTVVADAAGVREAAGGLPLTPRLPWARLLGRVFRTGGMFKGYRFAEMIDRARMDEALAHGRSARYVVGDGSALVDLLAWAEADFYAGAFDDREMQQLLHYLTGARRIPPRQWWRFVRKAPEVWLINVLDLVRPPAPDVLALVRIAPHRAMERIRARGEELEPWENEATLERLQEAYVRVVEVMGRRRVAVLEYDAEGLDPAAAAEAIGAVCKRIAPEPRAAEGR